MTISDGTKIKNITLYPLVLLSLEDETSLWMEQEEEEGVHPLLMIGKALTFKDETEDNALIISSVNPLLSIRKFIRS